MTGTRSAERRFLFFFLPRRLGGASLFESSSLWRLDGAGGLLERLAPGATLPALASASAAVGVAGVVFEKRCFPVAFGELVTGHETAFAAAGFVAWWRAILYSSRSGSSCFSF